MSAFEQISASVSALIASYKAAQSDGKVTLSEIWQLTGKAIQEIVQLTQRLTVPGAEKKRVALEAVEQFIDDFITPLDLPYIPNLVIEPIVDNAVKQVLMTAADGLIEASVSLFDQIGWPRKTELPEG